MAEQDPSPASVKPPAGRGSIWDRRLRELLEYRRVHGNLLVPRRWPRNPALANWVTNQRSLVRTGKLRPDRRWKLEALGIRWTEQSTRILTLQERWDQRLASLVAFLRSHGRLPVRGRNAAESRLAHWTAAQVYQIRHGRMSEERAERLQAAGVRPVERKRSASPAPAPRKREQIWHRWFEILRDFKAAHGHCRVPKSWPAEPRLASWIARQRRLNHKGRLSRERCGALESLGLGWSDQGHEKAGFDAQWDGLFQQLVEYRRVHGHCSVPLGRDEHATLALWVRYQRRQRARALLKESRIQRLDQLGFQWSGQESRSDTSSQRWDRCYRDLCAHRETEGSLDGLPDELVQWLARQRKEERRGKLSAERARLLHDLGIAGSRRDERWEAMYAKLLARRTESGPAEDDASIGRWIERQRDLQKTGRLSPDRVRRLSEAGLEWGPRRRRRNFRRFKRTAAQPSHA